MLYEDSFFNLLTNIDKNIKTIEDYTDEFDKVIRSKNICEQLNNFIKYQQHVINSVL